MKLTYIGHACFAIEKDSYVVVIDPYEDGSVPGLSNIREEADMVLCSHDHYDHNAVQTVRLREGGVNPFKISVIDTYHDEFHGAKRGTNKIHIFDDGTTKVAHFGDIGCDITVDMSPEDRAKLTRLDAIMVPVGGTYTIDSNQATELIRLLMPKVAIPMHYRSTHLGFGFDVLTNEGDFIKAFQPYGSLMNRFDSTYETEGIAMTQVNILRPKNSF